MSELRLTPAGHLRWRGAGSAGGASLEDLFHRDWREGLFTLAAERVEPAGSGTVRYWRGFAERYLSGLCHLPGGSDSLSVEPPSASERATLVLTAPPMTGGEYLSEATLLDIWSGLEAFAREAAAGGGLDALLHARAPKWSRVGRVCFHLAENPRDPARPFAFMATYAAGIGADGTLRHLPLRRALQQYAGADDRPALVKLLSPVHRAAERLKWVADLVETGEVYRPTAWPADRAYALLQSVPALEESGLSVRLPNWWRSRPRPRVSVTIGERKRETLGAAALLDFDVEVVLGEGALSVAELEALLAGEDGLVLFKGRWVEVDRARLAEALEHWQALKGRAESGQISFVEGMRLLAGASIDLAHEEEADAERPWVQVSAGRAMRALLSDLRAPGQLDPVEVGGALQATLRPYQREGVAWMRLLTGLGLGACLADDMGLGKTIQVLALLLCDRRDPRPSLLVVPASLLGNWRGEAERFAPSLRLVLLHPSETDAQTLAAIADAPEERLAGVDLVVTTYGTVSRRGWLAEVDWRMVILDEAQAIKNPGTRQTRAVKRLRAHARVALTGTPVENRLGDLWSLFDFLNPGLLGSAKTFKAFAKGLEQRTRDRYAPLRRLVGPYILRRLKTDRAVIADLPEKTEATRYCNLTRRQAALYQKTVDEMRAGLAAADGMARRGLVLQTLMRLKQICNHPSQLTGVPEYAVEQSGKFARLAEVCEEIAGRQEKVLVFTQFREIIDPLAEHLARTFGRPGLVLHGGTGVKRRKSLVAAFQDEDGPPFFVLSLKAGGTGLTLTAASHVIHFDRWWNPAVEDQATDRAFRIGQRRNVLVHKLVTRGTVEERIDALIAEKRQLTRELLGGQDEVNLTELDDDALLELVRLDVSKASP